MPDLYTDGEYARRHPGWHREHSAWKAARALEMMRRHGLSPATVAEVGSGAGGILAELQKAMPQGVEFDGFEVAPEAHAMALPLANERLRFHLGDFASASVRRHDLVLVMDVAEHVPDYLGFLGSVRSRGAMHLVHLPLDLSLLSMIQPERLEWARASVGHVHYFTAETAVAAIRNAGFGILDTMYTAVELDLPEDGRRLQRLQFARRLGRRVSERWTARLLGGFSLLILCR